jgi:flagellar basal body-associated protein FliL
MSRDEERSCDYSVNMNMKWLIVIILAIIGVLAAIVAVEYLTVPIHSLPSFIPGHKPVNGHYHKRGAVAAVIAIVALAGAAVVALRIVRSQDSQPVPTEEAEPTVSG